MAFAGGLGLCVLAFGLWLRQTVIGPPLTPAGWTKALAMAGTLTAIVLLGIRLASSD